MSDTGRQLLAEIEAFLAQRDLTPTKFGLEAVNDGHLVANLRRGNSVTLRTADKVRAYMRRQRSDQSAGAGRSSQSKHRRLLLIIGGGIAAYKCLDLIRRLRERGLAVRVVMTKAAHEFVTPLSVGALTNERVFTDLFGLDEEREIGHIRLSREADLILVAPATADLIAKLAGGHADDLASCVLLATDKPVLMAPAMNPRMWLHPATRRNVSQLKSDGVHFVGPNVGEMAEAGEAGEGRLAEVPELVAAVEGLLAAGPASAAAFPQGGGQCAQEGGDVVLEGGEFRRGALPLAGRHVLVTSGPTHEPIDPVRYLANRSSGKQGMAIAAAARDLGARVTLVSGPSTGAPPSGIKVVAVTTAREMMAAVERALPADIAVFAAAVADWRVIRAAAEKIKKKPGKPATRTLKLVENPDILRSVAQAPRSRRPALVIGFAAETENVIEQAKKKRKAKGADWIVANDVSLASGVMGGEHNSVHLITADGVESWPKMEKAEVARRLMERAAAQLAKVPAGT
jgi:phosphopantothenoylcysteine decarboxylase/phosphopantothenate--cysteine ligase